MLDGAPDVDQQFHDLAESHPPTDQKYTGRVIRLKKLRKVPRHRSQIRGYEHSIITRRKQENFVIGKSVTQDAPRESIVEGRFAPFETGADGRVQVCIRLKADLQEGLRDNSRAR